MTNKMQEVTDSRSVVAYGISTDRPLELDSGELILIPGLVVMFRGGGLYLYTNPPQQLIEGLRARTVKMNRELVETTLKPNCPCIKYLAAVGTVSAWLNVHNRHYVICTATFDEFKSEIQIRELPPNADWQSALQVAASGVD